MKILVAEDDLITRRILDAHLAKWGYEAVMVADGQEAWQLLQKDDAPRLAILDWMMPGLDGTSICREVRKLNLQPYIYLILLTSRGYKQDVIEGLEAGADEYLIKPFDPYELKARLRSGARIVELQDSLIQAREALREQAMHDPLTHLLNRRATMDFLLSELSRADREQTPLSVMMVDVDHFKSVNDRFGHLAGDEVLCEVARRLRISARTYDLVGRFGGEEFLVVAPACNTTQGLIQAERLREVVCSQPITIKDLSVEVTISAGVATSLDPNRQDMEALLTAADRALYRAKSGGRNRVERESSRAHPFPKPDPHRGSVSG
jgi:diguanylate cyclase (GGDEF)-like protein